MIHAPAGPGVVLSPHPDDAVLSAWSVLRAPGDVRVVNVCSATPPEGARGELDPLFGIDDSATFWRMRLVEDERALSMVGRWPSALGFLDGQYRDEPLDPPAIGGAVEDVARAASFICAPAGLGRHPDHTAVRDAALLLGSSSGIPVQLYADIPYAVSLGWPAWVTGTPERSYLRPEAKWWADLAPAGLGPERLTPRIVRLDQAAMRDKDACLRTYATQYEALAGGPIGRLSNPEILGYEVFFDVSLDFR